MKECINYKKIDSETLECQTCSNSCKIREGRVGVCGIRQNIKGKLYLLSYGKAVGVNIDPVEKKPLFHFLPGSFTYSFGTIGCNFRCPNCQNFDISQMFSKKRKIDEYKNLDWGYSLTPEQIVKNALENNCKSIAYTYTEPTVFVEYALDTMKLAKKEGLKNIWVSNGFMSPQTVDLILPYLNAINIDIKSFDDEFYKRFLGGRLQPILDNCKKFARKKVWLEITSLVIPTMSDDKNMLGQVAKFIKNDLGDFVPWHISAFSGAISWKLQHLHDTSPEAIKKIYQIGKEEGLKYVYAGNVWEKDIESTYCPGCGKIAIERIGYSIKRFDEEGKCKNCKTKIEGIL